MLILRRVILNPSLKITPDMQKAAVRLSSRPWGVELFCQLDRYWFLVFHSSVFISPAKNHC